MVAVAHHQQVDVAGAEQARGGQRELRLEERVGLERAPGQLPPCLDVALRQRAEV
jgi:hypothetical protein